jgi:membrane protein required for colicin V production
MKIDVLFLLFMVMAVFRGLRQGFIIAVGSAVAIILGLAAAMKLSALVAGRYSTNMHLSSRWLPVLAFVLIFAVVVIVVRLGARLAEKAVDLTLMGWLNKLAGVILYAAVYTTILSVLLFYAVEVRLVAGKTLAGSVTYPFIRPWGPAIINEFGKFVPWFEGMFTRLEDFFGRLGNSS